MNAANGGRTRSAPPRNGREVVQEQSDGGAVEGDVVRDHHEDVVGGGARQEMQARERTAVEVKGPLLGRNHLPLELRFVRGGQSTCSKNAVHFSWTNCTGSWFCTEKVVRRAACRSVRNWNAARIAPHIDRGADTNHESDIVGGALGGDLMEQPERLLAM